ncbi:MAG: M24 family metallopeptidase [Candidatus Thorarchaeota archaeon]|jgi:Xaa-Pro aminopeptidase
MVGYEIEHEKAIQACDLLEELGIDLWLIWVRETSQMADPALSLVHGGDLVWQSALLYSKLGEKIAIVGNFDADAVTESGIYNLVVPYTHGIKDRLLAALEKFEPEKLAINYSTNDVAADGLTVGMHKLLLENLKGTPYTDRLVSAEPIVSKLRGRKLPSEIERISKAVEITEAIFSELGPQLKVGMTETSIYDLFHEAMKRHNVTSAWNADHNPAVDAGPNKQFGHSGPTEIKTKADNLLHFDFGVKWDGYCSDIQRMFFFGKSKDVPEDIKTAFETVRDTIQKASEFIKPGCVGFEVDAIARDYVKERGFEEYQHALGHQLGRHAHDGGTLLGPLWDRYGDTPKGEVEKGNVFTLELYVTTKDFGQVSLEEDIVVTDSGCKFLSKPQRDLIYVS